MIIEDHINLLGDNPLIGKYDPFWGPRFVDMSEPYSKQLIELAENIAIENRIKIHKGVYCVINGPSLETRAEYRFLRYIGADAVGMSTIPENIVARQMGLDVFAISVLTDECYPDALKPVSVEEIIENANAALPDLNTIFHQLVLRI
jgi:purine-nucleoside phosphorylase